MNQTAINATKAAYRLAHLVLLSLITHALYQISDALDRTARNTYCIDLELKKLERIEQHLSHMHKY